jgi:hypothetical protein
MFNLRAVVFLSILTITLAGVGLYAYRAMARASSTAAQTTAMATTPMDRVPASAQQQGSSGKALQPPRPFVIFRSTALGDGFGRVSLAYLDSDERLVGALRCDRLHYAAGAGVCLETTRSGLGGFKAHVFDADFVVRSSFSLAGPPSRARVSRDGRLAAFTVFVSGHSYDSPGFSTRTSIVDTQTGKYVVEDLETMGVFRDGKLFKSADFNFWGVTFSKEGRKFYASLGTAGKVLLVRGDLDSGRMDVVHDDVECPSLSPNDRFVAFKRRAPMDAAGRRIWRLYVMDLDSRKETLLAKESRNVDDQVEWLDNLEILYALPRDSQQASAAMDVWALAADAGSKPRLLLPFAFSPASVR